MPQLYKYALSGVAGSGATRSGYTSPKLFVAINGTQVASARPVDANKVLDGSLSVTEVLNETPNTCALVLKGIEPAEGADIVVTLGSINNLDRLYAGTVLNRTHAYVGTPAAWHAPINLIDYTWHLTRRKVSGSFTNVAPAVVAAALVAAVPGFTLWVAPGLPTLDTFSYTDIDVLAAFTQLAKRIGGYCDVDYQKTIKLFITDSSVTNPTDLTAAHVSLSEFSFTKDLSQVRTRMLVEGGGVTALALCVPGETIIPVETIAWYNALGGTIKSGPQHVSYAAAVAGGIGSIVGPSAAPSVQPTLALAAGAGLSTGTYHYAYTDVTAAGESLPSPLASIVTGALVADPITAPLVGYSNGGPGPPFPFVAGDAIRYWAYTFTTAAGETLPSPTFAPAGTYPVSGGPYAAGTVIPIGPAGTTGRNVYRTTQGGSQLKLVGSIADNTTTSFGDTVFDGALGANAPTVNTASLGNQVALSGIALGVTGTTGRNIYRTVVNGAQLKLQQTIANNTATVGVQDATADGSLGANAPTSDTSGLSTVTGAVLAGSTSLLTAGAGPFASAGGWAAVGQQLVRYTGITGNTLTGIPASGPGAIVATVNYGTIITASPALIGIPASGVGSILYPILPGDPVNLLVQVDDAPAQATLAALLSQPARAPYRDQVIADGATGYWRLGEASGTVAADNSGHGNTGTISGGVTVAQPGALADGDTAALLDGASGKVTAPSLPMSATCSVEVWVKTTSTSGSWFSNRGSGPTAGRVYIGLSGATAFVFTDDTTTSFLSSRAINDGLWHHVVWTNDGTTSKFYIDGALDATQAQTHAAHVASVLSFGWDNPNNNWLTGSLDEIALYDYVLTAAQVANHYGLQNAALVPAVVDDGVVEDSIQDGTIGETEARARGTAQLALCKSVLVSLSYKTRDRNTHAGRTIHCNLGSPTNLTGDFQIQHVTIDTFQPALFPTYTVQASSNRFSLEDLLRLARKAA